MLLRPSEFNRHRSTAYRETNLRLKAVFLLPVSPCLHTRCIRKVKMDNRNNVFEAILKYGHDEDFVPETDTEFLATDAPAGSDEKMETLRRRILEGYPVWHCSTPRIGASESRC